MHCFGIFASLTVLLILNIKDAFSEEKSASLFLEERLFEKMIEINLNIQKALDKIANEKERQNVPEPSLRQIFNAVGSNMNSWFHRSRVNSSSYSDLTTSSVYNYFSIAGQHTTGNRERRFFINKHYGGCDGDTGHMVICDDIHPNAGCNWEKHPKYPQFLYSTINSVDAWNRRMFDRADFVAIFLKT